MPCVTMQRDGRGHIFGRKATSVVLLDQDVQLSDLVVDVHAAALALALQRVAELRVRDLRDLLPEMFPLLLAGLFCGRLC